MHTFFINTSKMVSDILRQDTYQDVLFEELLYKGKLVIYDPSDELNQRSEDQNQIYPNMEKIRNTARHIAEKVDQETDFYEKISLIVYFENRRFQTTPALTAAEENLLSLITEEALVWELGNSGKRPENVVFVFGEWTKRSSKGDNAFKQDVKKSLWELIELPPVDKTCDFLIKTEKECRNINDKQENIILLKKKKIYDFFNGEFQSKDRVSEYIISKNGRKGIMNSDDKNWWKWIIEYLTKSIIDKLQALRGNFDIPELYNCLDDSVSQLRESMVGGDGVVINAESKKFMYLPMETESRDEYEKHRSICRLMMYIYAFAYNYANLSNSITLSDGKNSNKMISLPAAGSDEMSAVCLPKINYDSLYSSLREKIWRCENSKYLGMKVPDENLADKEDGNPKKNVIKFSLEDKGLEFSPKPTIGALKNEVNALLGKAEEQNKSKIPAVENYLRAAKNEYDDIKDDILNEIKKTQDNCKKVSEEQDEKKFREFIYSLDTTIAKCQEKMRLNEEELLKDPGEIGPFSDMTDLLEFTKKQKDYYFDSLGFTKPLIIGFIVFLAAFSVPYLAMRFDLFDTENGFWFFIGTAAICLASLIYGRTRFVILYREKIIKLVNTFLEKYNQRQRNDFSCLNHFHRFLYEIVPNYYKNAQLIAWYQDFRKKLQVRKKQITYHNESREERISVITSLLLNLDKEKVNKDEEMSFLKTDGNQIPVIDPGKDRVGNRDIYILTPNDVRKAIKID